VAGLFSKLSGQQDRVIRERAVLLNTFCPLITSTKVLALRATMLWLLTLVFLAISGGLLLGRERASDPGVGDRMA
jgi:hypothetical protein